MNSKWVFISSAVLGAYACGPQSLNNEETSNTKNKLAELEARLEKLEKRPVGAPPRRRGLDPQKAYPLKIHPTDGVRGADNAKVTVVEVSEHACPYCAQVKPVLEQLLEKYPSDVLKVVSKPYVVHPQTATEPALAVCAAQKQGRFPEYSKAVWESAWTFEGRPKFDASKLSKNHLLTLAKKLKLDSEKFIKDMSGPECREAINRSQRELAQLGVRGTPALFVNGRPYVGPRTVEGLGQAIELAAKSN